MIKIRDNKIEFYKFESSLFEGCDHGIFTRHGGISPEPWNSLNQGGTVGDSRENVIENRKSAFECFHRPVESIFDVWQVHSTDCICTENPRHLDQPHEKADAIITNNPNITLFMRFADCVPILIFDPVEKIVGIIHAGWKGTLNNIVRNVIFTVQKKYGTKPENIIAGIGPSIGPDHYEIGKEIVRKTEDELQNIYSEIIIKQNEKYYLNLWKTNELLLREQGVKNIEIANICTACNTKDWYSHRKENGKTGRFGALIFLTGEANA